MFNQLSQKLLTLFDKIRGKGSLSEADVEAVLRDIRIALLEADVALPTVREFVQRIKEKATGQDVIKSLTPGQMVIKIVRDELVHLLGDEEQTINLAAQPPVVMMMVGLQGSGKTTSTGKLALWLRKNHKKKILMVSVDVYRPAAQKQLEVLGKQLGIDTLSIVESEKPKDIIARAQKQARQGVYDVLLVDTAGRLEIDTALMDELKMMQKALSPTEIFFVADAMTGQSALPIAKGFNENVPLTGIILTRLDGDARGGAALSIRHITGCPIKFLGTGEKTDAFELFDATRVANRILDMGDVIGMIEKAQEFAADEESLKLADNFQKGIFTMNDMLKQMEQILKMGGVKGMMSLLPGVSKIKDKIDEIQGDDQKIKRQIALIQSMTEKERKNPDILNANRRKRIAKGAGQEVSDLNRLIKQYEQMKDLMKHLKKGKMGLFKNAMQSMMGGSGFRP